MKKLLSICLCAVFLLASVGTTVFAETGMPADVSRDGEVTLEDASRLFFALSGQLTLTAAQTALADNDRNGTVDLSDVTQAFYYVNGKEDLLPVAVAFTAQYMDVSDTARRLEEPLVFYTRSEFSQFAAQHEDVSFYSWLRTFKNTDNALIAVPMTTVGYVASVSVRDNILDIAVVTPSVPAAEHTAYAFLSVDPQDIDGKELHVMHYTDTSGKRADPTQTVYHNSSGHGYSCTMNEDGQTATFRLSMEMSSLGYDITDMRYITTDDALIVIYDLLVPNRTHGVMTALETITGVMTVDAGDYTGQPIVLYEQTREIYEPIIGIRMPFTTVFQQDFGNADPAENSTQLITSLEQLEQVYADDHPNAPDYTVGFTQDYFEEHALILVKAYHDVLPEAVTIDGMGVSGETVTVSILFSFREWVLPALYHGRLLLEIDAADGEYIKTVRCQSHHEIITA